MTLAEKVRSLRQKMGWTQSALAAHAELTQATVSRIEGGLVTQPRMEQLQKIAKALGTTIDHLAGDGPQVPINEVLKDTNAQVVFRGWGNLSSAQREQLASLVKFFEQQEEQSEDRGK